MRIAETEFFDRIYLPYYTPFQTPEETGAEVDFLLSVLRPRRGAPVLDLCCGHGRHDMELARRGYSVVGVDLSAPSLARARVSAVGLEPRPRYVQADVRALPLAPAFETCFIWSSAFACLEQEAEAAALLARVRELLEPGGRLLIQTMHHSGLERGFVPTAWFPIPGGGRLTEHRDYDRASGLNVIRIEVRTAAGDVEETVHRMRIYRLEELSALCERAGLTVTGAWGEASGAPLTDTSRRLILRAQR